MKEIRCGAIDQNAKSGVTNTSHNPVYKQMRETRVDQNEMKVTPVNPIKCLCEIDFENGGFLAQGLDGVEDFLGSANSFMNLPMIQECKLFFFNMSRQERLDAVCNNFGYDLVNAVTQRYWPIIIEASWIV